MEPSGEGHDQRESRCKGEREGTREERGERTRTSGKTFFDQLIFSHEPE
jgi:hypothetical protein